METKYYYYEVAKGRKEIVKIIPQAPGPMRTTTLVINKHRRQFVLYKSQLTQVPQHLVRYNKQRHPQKRRLQFEVPCIKCFRFPSYAPLNLCATHWPENPYDF
jgi:hypothetical protein